MLGLLRLNIQFFAEGGEGGSGDEWVDSFVLDGSEDTNKKDEKPEEKMIPKKRFDDVNTRYKALNDDYKNRQTEYDEMVKQLDDSAASAKELEKTIKAGTDRITVLEGVLSTMLESELALIHEEYRELVPADKPIEEQLAWLGKAKATGLFVSKGFEYEIGGISNPKQSGNKGKTEGMSPIQLMTMGYSNY